MSAACVVALAFPVYLGAAQSQAFATSWPNAAAFISVFRPLAAHSTGPMLVEDPSIAKYYLPSGHQWRRWSSTRNIVLPSGASTGTTTGIIAAGNAATFAYYIAHGYFAYVALNFTDTTALDHGLATELHHNPRYHTIDVVPYGTEVKPVGQGIYVSGNRAAPGLGEPAQRAIRSRGLPRASARAASTRRATAAIPSALGGDGAPPRSERWNGRVQGVATRRGARLRRGGRHVTGPGGLRRLLRRGRQPGRDDAPPVGDRRRRGRRRTGTGLAEGSSGNRRTGSGSPGHGPPRPARSPGGSDPGSRTARPWRRGPRTRRPGPGPGAAAAAARAGWPA